TAEQRRRFTGPRHWTSTKERPSGRLCLQAYCTSTAMKEIEAAVRLPSNASVETLQNALQACLLDFDKAMQACELEAGAGSLMKGKEGELQAATSRLSKTMAARGNLSRATTSLANIVENHSLDKATADSFVAIRGKVSDVFAQIHSPPEYTLGSFSDGQLIIRRDDARQHDVNQVSTGQRAALALSIFLALNESATTAPPVILIDDPVAHIDDLNALSFLDYLRDVVVGSRKQVFFATADARLAALFQRKFEFLGEQRFKRINLTTK
ncbi:ABC transporter ATP-binding protein, partial [Hydrogenophaga sp.]|uniref:ABC transporter ATP-binding protein n=1 Tax=Hydrogenophaga sp. TaxID=1904254 RepID=UPI0025B8C8F6